VGTEDSNIGYLHPVILVVQIGIIVWDNLWSLKETSDGTIFSRKVIRRAGMLYINRPLQAYPGELPVKGRVAT